jgi:CHAP domain
VARWGAAAGMLAASLLAASGSPAAAAATDGSYQVAFQANTSHLFTYNPASNTDDDTGLGMAAGTSASIAAGYKVTFQANTGDLYLHDTANGNVKTGLGMAAKTSPAIAASPGGGYEVAFQANTSHLFTYDPGNNTNVNTGLGMMAGTSPAIAASPTGGYEVAFQANTSHLFTYDPGNKGSDDTGLGMAAGTSPAIAAPSIAVIADSQLGYQDSPSGTFCNPFSAYWGSGSECSNGLYSEEWCADFAAWTWAQAGVPFTYAWITGDYLNGGAISFYNWAVANGTWHAAGSGYTPRPGDVVVYALNDSYAAHAAVVASYTPGDAGPNVVNGDWWSFDDGANGGVASGTDQSDVVSDSTTYPILGYASP